MDYTPFIGQPLVGRPTEAHWDPELRPALEARGRAVYEEQMIEVLLDDLRGD